jgi:hypothetical protein
VKKERNKEKMQKVEEASSTMDHNGIEGATIEERCRRFVEKMKRLRQKIWHC